LIRSAVAANSAARARRAPTPPPTPA
jgi:hypothetical protein